MLQLARGLSFINTTGSTLSPGAALEITAMTEEEGEIVLSIQKPTSAGIAKGLIVFNGECEVPNNGGGFVQLGPAILALKTGTPAIGQTVGPVNNQWYVSVGGVGYTYLGNDPANSFPDACVLIPSATGVIVQTPSGGIPKRVGTTVSFADCNVYHIAGTGTTRTLTSSGLTIAVGNMSAANDVGGTQYVLPTVHGGALLANWEDCGG